MKERTVSLFVAVGQLTRLLTFLFYLLEFQINFQVAVSQRMLASTILTPEASTCGQVSFPEPVHRSRHFFIWTLLSRI